MHSNERNDLKRWQHGAVNATLLRILVLICLLAGVARFYVGDSGQELAVDWQALKASFVAGDAGAAPSGSDLSGFDLSGFDIVGRVSHVKDGDSLVLKTGRKEIEVRLHGIDAPEWKQPHGEAAKRALKGLVLNRQVGVQVVTVDSYDRTVGVVYLQSRNINLAMVESGNAWWYRRFAGRDNALREAEDLAREQRLGLWRDKNPVPPWVWRQDSTGGFNVP